MLSVRPVPTGRTAGDPLSQVHRSMNTSMKLMFFCGKRAAGKSTLARNLAVRENAALLVHDDFLNALFPGEITDVPGFVKCHSRYPLVLPGKSSTTEIPTRERKCVAGVRSFNREERFRELVGGCQC